MHVWTVARSYLNPIEINLKILLKITVSNLILHNDENYKPISKQEINISRDKHMLKLIRDRVAVPDACPGKDTYITRDKGQILGAF